MSYINVSKNNEHVKAMIACCDHNDHKPAMLPSLPMGYLFFNFIY